MENKYLVLLYCIATFFSVAFFQNFEEVVPVRYELAVQQQQRVDDQFVDASIPPYPDFTRHMRATTMKYMQATLRNMNLTWPCRRCPNVYLPVCTKDGKKYTTFKNRCLFLCSKSETAHEIRRGICIYW